MGLTSTHNFIEKGTQSFCQDFFLEPNFDWVDLGVQANILYQIHLRHKL